MSNVSVYLLFASFYFAPALLILLIIWAAWRLLRLFEMSASVRRFVFIGLVTFGLSPMLVPAGTIMTALVPHGVLLAMPELGYYIQFARYVFPSFLVTGVIAGLISLKFVTLNEAIEFKWKLLIAPTVVLAICVTSYLVVIPERNMPSYLNHDVIEEQYGVYLNNVIELLRSEEKHRTRETDRLRAVFAAKSEIFSVSLEEPDTKGTVYGKTFHYIRDKSPPSSACSRSGPIPEGQKNLMRCTLDYGTFSKVEVLRYTREFQFKDENLLLLVQFEYEKLIDLLESQDET